MKKTKKVIANILDKVGKVAAVHAKEIAREVAISLLLENREADAARQKKAPQAAKKNPAKKTRPKRTAPVKNKQAPNN